MTALLQSSTDMAVCASWQGDQFNSTVIRYVGNVPNNSTSSGRKLLQSQGITVYYNLEQVQ